MTENTQVLEIPDKYKHMGVKRGFDPQPADKLRLIVEATSGEGKTTFVASDPNSVILDFDRAAGNVYGGVAWRFPISTWDQYRSIADSLIADKRAGSLKIGRVVLDTADDFMDMIDLHLVTERLAKPGTDQATKPPPIASMTEFGQGGQGYKRLRAAFMREIKALEAAGFTWTICCQLKTEVEKIGETIVVRKRSMLFPTAMDLLCMSADMVAYVHQEKVVEPIFEMRKTGDGKERRVRRGERKVTKYILDVQPESGFADMKRRILGLDQSIELPETGGYAYFSKVYNDKIAELKAKAKDSKTPS